MSSEKMLECMAPIFDMMADMRSRSMTFSVCDEDDKPVITVCIAARSKAPLLKQAYELIDAAYDAGESYEPPVDDDENKDDDN